MYYVLKVLHATLPRTSCSPHWYSVFTPLVLRTHSIGTPFSVLTLLALILRAHPFIASAILTKMLGAPRFDSALAMGYLTDLSLAQGFAVFPIAMAAAKKHHTKMAALARLGAAFATWRAEATFQAECLKLITSSHWGAVLTTLAVPFDRRQLDASQVLQPLLAVTPTPLIL